MVRVSYIKKFLSGNLNGMSVTCSYNVPDYAHGLLHIKKLQLLTESNPGSDCCTSAKFFVHRLELSDV